MKDTIKKYNLRIKPRLDGKYCLVLSHDRPAYVLSRDKKGLFRIFPQTKEWDYKMLHEEGIQNYLSSLLESLYGYKFEVEDLEYKNYLLRMGFSDE